MVNYSFDDLKRDLEICHDLHFRYKEKEYSISHSQYEWHLSEFYKDDQTFKTQWDLLQCGMINGKRLSEIWTDIDVTDIF